MAEIAFHCPLTFAAPAAADDQTVSFAGLAYTGGLMENGTGTFAVELGTLVHNGRLPLLWQHDHRETIGTVDAVTVAGDLRIVGRLFATDPRGADVLAKSRRGFPWGLSIGITGAIEPVPMGSARVVNGRSLVGPFNLLRHARMREVSVVSVAADAATALQFNRPLRPHRMPNGAWIYI